MKSILGIIMIGGAVAVGIMFIKPQLSELKAKRAQFTTYNAALNKADELAQQRDRLLASYNNIDEQKLSRLDGMLPRDIDNVKLALEIETVASKLGLSLKGINVKDPRDNGSSGMRASQDLAAPPYGTAEITFTVVGDYDKFVTFLEQLEQSLRIIDVQKVAFNAPRNQTLKTDSFEFTVSISTYWVKDNAVLTAQPPQQ